MYIHIPQVLKQRLIKAYDAWYVLVLDSQSIKEEKFKVAGSSTNYPADLP